MKVVNLSSRPFVNERPVVRLSILLWVLGVAFLVMNVYSYSTYWSDSKEIRGEISDLRQANEKEAQELSDLSQKVSGVGLSELNAHAEFLNDLIRYRTFPWSRLFDSLEEVLPYDVRLASVQPRINLLSEMGQRSKAPRTTTRTRRSSRRRPPPKTVPKPAADEVREIELELRGVAKNEEVILELIETLFAHPLFKDPDFLRENPDGQNREISFDLKVTYLLDLRPNSATQESEQDTPESDTSEQDIPEQSPEATAARAADAAQQVAGATQDPSAQEREPSQLTSQPGTAPPSAGAESSESLAAEDGARSEARRIPQRRQPVARQTPTRRIAPSQPARRPPGRPAAGAPAAGTPAVGTPTAGTPTAGAPAAGTTIMTPTVIPTVRPNAGAASGSARRADRPTPPAKRPTVPRRPERPTVPPADPEEDDPRVRPRFVEPSASGAARLGGSN